MEIFKSTARNDDGSKSLFAVSGVSKRWRDISLSNSTLWSEFGVDKDDIGHSQHVCENADPSAVFPRIALMLQRSRQYPLSISVDTGGKDSLFNAFYIDQLVSLLSPHVIASVVCQQREHHGNTMLPSPTSWLENPFPFSNTFTLITVIRPCRKLSSKFPQLSGRHPH